MISEEGIQLHALLEVFYSFSASDLLKEIKVTIDVNASSNESMPVNTLELDVGVVLLKLEVNSLKEVDVGSFDSVHILSCHFELVEVEVLGEHLHF